MIGSLHKGAGARGLVSYLLQEQDASGKTRPRADIIGGTLAGQTPRELAEEFGQLRQLRPTLGKAIVHQSLRVSPEDRELTDQEWTEIGRRWAEGMGHDGYVTVCHGDHIHIAASRIRIDGSVVSDSHDYRRSETLVREIERDFGLHQVEASHLLEPERSQDHRKAMTLGRIEMVEQGNPSAIDRLQTAIDAAMENRPSVTDFVNALQSLGITPKPNLASTGKMNGFAYEVDGIHLSAKEIGRGYTWSNLQKKGLDYEQSRDREALDRCRRAATSHLTGGIDHPAPAAGGPDRAIGPSPASLDGRGDRGNLEAPGAGGRRTDQIDGRHQDGPGRERGDLGDGQHRPDRDKNNQQNPGDGTHLSTQKSPGGPRSGAVDVASENTGSLAGPGDSAGDRSRVGSGSYDRIVELGATAAGPGALAGPGAKTGTELRQDDRKTAPGDDSGAWLGQAYQLTRTAVQRWLSALPAGQYNVGVRRSDGEMIEHTWTPQKLLESIPWLRRENATGADIYARPNDTTFILIDDVPPSRLPVVRQHSAAVVETSAKNHQVWVKLPEKPSQREATTIAAWLAKRYEGDPGGADFRHLGRLPGFTNRKPLRTREDGRSPYVLIHDWSGRVAEFGSALIEQARAALAKEDTQRREAALRAAEEPVAGNPVSEYQKHAKRALEAAEADVAAGRLPRVDWSTIDFRVAQAMARSGHSTDGIVQGIEGGSPNLAERKGRSMTPYAERTVKAAIASPDVQQHFEKKRQAVQVAQKGKGRDGQGLG